MTYFKHLSQLELSAYRDDSVEIAVRHEIGRHLLKCPECRERLPLPTVEQFWSALMTDELPVEITDNVKLRLPFFSSLLSIWSSHGNLVLGGGALVLLLGFSFLIWQNIGGAPQDVAHNLEKNKTIGADAEFPLPAEPTVNFDRDSETKTNSVIAVPTPRVEKTDLPESKPGLKTKIGQNSERKSLPRQEQISSTRGASFDCREEKNVELEFSAEKEDLVFKWKKVPNAAKYHLYISDDNEILIDEFETESETSFILRKPLDPLKTYKWKIIITLENGETVLGSSSKFTVKDFQTSRLKPENKKTAGIRCPANE